ncbi:MAG: NUDIX hydrolase [Anaerolineae bacterium]
MNYQPTTKIVAALIRRQNRLLLVKQQGPNDAAPSWALPGGAVEPGELLTEALAREVREETGLEIVSLGGLVYALQHDNPARKRQSLVFVFDVVEWQGSLTVADPDRLILEAKFLPRAKAIALLEDTLPWRVMREPIVAYLRGTAGRGAVWLYRSETAGDTQLVARLEPDYPA